MRNVQISSCALTEVRAGNTCLASLMAVPLSACASAPGCRRAQADRSYAGHRNQHKDLFQLFCHGLPTHSLHVLLRTFTCKCHHRNICEADTARFDHVLQLQDSSCLRCGQQSSAGFVHQAGVHAKCAQGEYRHAGAPNFVKASAGQYTGRCSSCQCSSLAERSSPSLWVARAVAQNGLGTTGCKDSMRTPNGLW